MSVSHPSGELPDAVTERLPVVGPASGRTSGPGPWAPDEPPTGPVHVVPAPRVPVTSVPHPAPPAGPAGRPVALWAAAGLAALLALGLFVDVVTAMSISDGDAGQWFVVLYQLPVLMLAAAWAGIAYVVGTARPTAPWLTGVSAACTLVTALDSYDGPGVLVCLGATALAGALALSSTLRGTLTAPITPPVPPVLLAARTCASWTVAALLLGALHSLNVAGYGGDTGALVVAGVLFLLLSGASGWAAAVVARLVSPRGARPTPDLLRIVLLGVALLGLLAAILAGTGSVALLGVLPLLAAQVVAVWVPTDVRAVLGETELEPVRRLGAAAGAGSTPSATGTRPGGVEAAGRAAYDALPSSVRDASTTVKVVAGAFAAVLFVVVAVIATAGSNASAIGVLMVVSGLVAGAAAFTPTMPAVWRAICAGGGLLAVVVGVDGTVGYTSSSNKVWVVGLLPLVLVGYAAYGHHANRVNGVTSTAPGWVGARPRIAPPGPPLTFATPVTARGRSQIRLEVVSTLEPATVLAVVRRSADVRGNWFVVGGDRIEHDGDGGDDGAGLVIGSGGGHAAFRARVRADASGTRLVLGGLDRWTQRRSYYFGFIPAGPAHVKGYWMYTLFLQTVASELRACDPRSSAVIIT